MRRGKKQELGLDSEPCHPGEGGFTHGARYWPKGSNLEDGWPVLFSVWLPRLPVRWTLRVEVGKEREGAHSNKHFVFLPVNLVPSTHPTGGRMRAQITACINHCQIIFLGGAYFRLSGREFLYAVPYYANPLAQRSFWIEPLPYWLVGARWDRYQPALVNWLV